MKKGRAKPNGNLFVYHIRFDRDIRPDRGIPDLTRFALFAMIKTTQMGGIVL